MAGYWQRPDETAKVMTPDGYFKSGDLGRFDAEGYLWITGRAKDLIIRSGHNIDPKVIEDALGAHPAVALCAAVGAPDAYAGELPVAFATLKPGSQVTEAELLAFTAERVDEGPAKPKSITVLNAMPVTNVGKIYKPELRTLAAGAVVQALALKAEPTLDPQGVADHWWHGEWRWRTQAAGEDKKAQAPARGSTAPLPGLPDVKESPKR